jgi:hypothetical protein
VSLPVPIVISVQQGYAFPPFSVKLANGDEATVSFNIDDNVVNQFLGTLGASGFAVTHVSSLQIKIVVADVSTDDIDRLYCRHASEPTFKTHGRDYQRLESHGKRVVEDVIDASNLILLEIQTRYGQYWLELLNVKNNLYPNFLDDTKAEWREPNGNWASFCSAPLISHATLVWAEKDTYLEVADWATIGASLKAGSEKHVGFSLLASARRAFDAGEIARAMVDLAASVEWASETFVTAKLKGVIPDKSLKELLRYSFYRILTDWVVPLADVHLPGELTNDDLKYLHEIRNLRGQSAHSQPRTEVLEQIQNQFATLINTAARVISILTNENTPKIPPYPAASLAGGKS